MTQEKAPTAEALLARLARIFEFSADLDAETPLEIPRVRIH